MARGALQSSGEAGVERVRRISDTPSDDPPLVRAPGAGGRRSVRVGRRFHVAHHRTRRAGRHVAPDARGIARAARAPRGRRHAAAAMRGVDARPPRGRGVGRDLPPRVLRRATATSRAPRMRCAARVRMPPAGRTREDLTARHRATCARRSAAGNSGASSTAPSARVRTSIDTERQAGTEASSRSTARRRS